MVAACVPIAGSRACLMKCPGDFPHCAPVLGRRKLRNQQRSAIVISVSNAIVVPHRRGCGTSQMAVHACSERGRENKTSRIVQRQASGSISSLFIHITISRSIFYKCACITPTAVVAAPCSCIPFDQSLTPNFEVKGLRSLKDSRHVRYIQQLDASPSTRSSSAGVC
jgi:hypothetical protein